LEALAREMGEPNLAVEAITAQGTLFAVPSVVFDASRAEAILEGALEMARELGNERVEARIQWSLMMANNNQGGSPEKSLAHGQRSLELARKHGLDEQLAYTLHDIARPLTMVGRFEEALASSEEAGRLFRQQNNMPMVVDNMATASAGYFLYGRLDLSLERAEEALTLAQAIGSRWGESYAKMRLAFPQAEVGLLGQAMESWTAAREAAKEASFIGLTFFVPAFMAVYHLSSGDCADGGRLMERLAADRKRGWQLEKDANEFRTETIDTLIARVNALLHLCQGDPQAARALLPDRIPGTSSNFLDAAAYGLLTAVDGQVLLAVGDFDEARVRAASTRRTLEGISVKIANPALLQIEGEALLGLDRREEGRAALQTAAQMAREMNARRQLWSILGVLARLADQDGDENAAAALRAEARAIIDLMADDLDDAWRQAFLALPEVRQAGGF
jgi:tetratricopeptide (TPR) repeat protein